MERADLEQWRAKEVARLFALVDTERRYYQDIVAALPVGLLILTAELTVRSANRFFRQIFNYRNEDILRRRLEQILPAPELRRQVLEVISSGKPIYGIRAEIGGEPRTHLLRIGILPLRNWDDETEEALLVVEDLSSVETDRSNPAAAAVSPVPIAGLGISEGLVEQLDAIVWEFDANVRRFVFVNAGAQHVLGYPAERWVTDSDFWLGRIHPDDRQWMQHYLDALIAKGSTQTCEYRALHASGGPVWVRESIRVRRDAQGNARRLYGIAQDITGDRSRQEQWLQAQRMDAVTRLSARLSHDFNNSLMILSGYTEEVENALPTDSPARADVREMRLATERMSAIGAELVQLARKPQLSTTEVNVSEWASALARKLAAVVPAGVEFTSDIKPDCGSTEIDTVQVEQAVTALVRHIATRRLPAGGKMTFETGTDEIVSSASSTVDALPPGPYATLTLIDNGPMLDAESRRRFFEPFLSKEGDPLGVALAYQVINFSGGDIWITSDEQCTRFTTLLQRLVHDVPEVPPAPQPVAELPPPEPIEENRRTVLVVEDETSIRMLIRKILTRHGYGVMDAPNGEEAMKLVMEHSGAVDMLLTDVMLPSMGGRELATLVRERFPESRVLFISGYNDETTLTNGDLPSQTSYLQKPFTLGSLLLKVREMLAESRA